jgi:hypothetical protein
MAVDAIKHAFDRLYIALTHLKTRGGRSLVLGAAVLIVAAMVSTGAMQAHSSRLASSIILTLRLHEIATHFTYVPIKSLIGSKKPYNQGDYWAGDDALKTMAGVTVGHESTSASIRTLTSGRNSALITSQYLQERVAWRREQSMLAGSSIRHQPG